MRNAGVENSRSHEYTAHGSAARQGNRHWGDCRASATRANPANGGARSRGRGTCWQPEVTLPSRGFYYPPTLLSNVHPTSIVAQQEIFGPVLAAMTFRTPHEAVELANNTVYGLASCVWSENINVALHVAAQIKAGVVWVNCTNLFDAACGFGGYRESGLRSRRWQRRLARIHAAELAEASAVKISREAMPVQTPESDGEAARCERSRD